MVFKKKNFKIEKKINPRMANLDKEVTIKRVIHETVINGR
jgi:hypothetical protein